MTFDHALLKIERANKHISDVEAAIRSLPDAYASSIQIDRDLAAQSIQYDFADVHSFLGEVALMTGDAIHNLKTSLDYAWIAALLRFDPSRPVGRFSKFPVRKTPEELEAALRGAKIHVAAPALFNCILTKIQPYPARNSLLWCLHDLDIADKHKLLLPLVKNAVAEGVQVEDDRGFSYKGGTWTIRGTGPFFISFPVDYHIKDKGKLATEVVFSEGSALEGAEVLDTLQLFSKASFNVVDDLRNLS